MKRFTIAIFAMMLLMQPSLKADEGMWLPLLVERLNYADMQKMGLELTPEEIYSVNQSSLKDAIVQFDNGCTGEIISGKGLILTNHHCGHGRIQAHSTPEHDYLTDGFWAMSLEEELPNEGLTVSFLIRMEEVTGKVLNGVNATMTEAERQKKIRENMDIISKEATKDTDYKASIKSFFDGNEYYMFIMEEYQDVRLVGAPPSSIGNFGGDTDNWMWPRHTGDFSMFRVYTAPDGSPAKYSKDNIPMKPKHHLPVSIDGVKKGDFSMIMGYPGGTDRYMTSFGIQQNLDKMYPTRIKIRRKKLDIMEKYMKQSDKVRIQYASKRDQVANYWKNFIGMKKGLIDLKVPQKKAELENKLTEWIERTPERKEKYGNALKHIEDAYKVLNQYAVHQYYFIEAIYQGPEVFGFSRNFETVEGLLEKEDMASVKEFMQEMDEDVKKFFKDYYKAIDRDIMAAMFEMYDQDVPEEMQPEMFKKLVKKKKGNYQKMAEDIYEGSMFDDQKKLSEWMEDPDLKTLTKDPVYQLQDAFFKNYFGIRGQLNTAQMQKTKGRRLFMEALRTMESDISFYPDANFTMRLTYGKVKGYEPRDAVDYLHYTTLHGIMEKEDPDNPEFIVPEKLKQIYERKDYGLYGEGEVMKVCFLTNHDITGGNSGSPVIDGKGRLIGLAFDGNWEAMSGDIAFEPELQRTINVDIRYVLLIIDKFAGAQNLIDEMDIVRTTRKGHIDKSK
ncbi:MAG: S46 family peptidase, partial [Bacteroidota bacterium]